MTSRSGAALIVALVVLAALLLLGLPFLFTQSSSLAGTRSFAHGQQALIGRASAENVGIAAAAAAMDWHWRAGGVPQPIPGPVIKDEWTSLYWGLSAGGTVAEVRRLGETRVGLDLRQGSTFRPDPARSEPTIGGVAISDEHGKLDPNHLDSIAWTRLLTHVGIADWDDGTPPTPDITRNQLARALADLRFRRALVPDGRITRLEQLLLAEPPVSARRRHGLTRAELALLAPHLSLHGAAQARSGLIDLGTVINNVASGSQAMLDSPSPGVQLAHPAFPTLVGAGSVIVDAADDGSLPGVSPADTRDPQLMSPALAKGRALALAVPPPVNLHEATAAVRAVLFGVPAPQPPPSAAADPIPGIITGLATAPFVPASAPARQDALLRPRTWFDLLDPLGHMQELSSATPFGSRPGEPGVPLGAPALPNPASGANETVVVVDGGTRSALTLEATAQVIHLHGTLLDRLPGSAYVRLDGNMVPADPLTQPGVSGSEYIHYRSCSVASATRASLHGVTRGLALPPGSGGGSAVRFFVDGLKATIIAARELPPLAIASPGVVTVETAATATDPAGRQTAQRARTVVAQTVAQEFPLEARWERQSHFHATLAQRHGSLLASFPAAVDRVQGRLPDEAVSPTPAPAPDPLDDPYLDKRIGVRPAVLRTPLSATHLTREWTAPLGGRENGNDALRGGPANNQQAALNYATSDLFPEGLRLSTSRRLAWLFAPTNANGAGFFAHAATSDGATQEILPRQFGFWVRPDASWTGRTEPVVLLEVRGPLANAGRALLGIPSSDPTAVSDARLAEGSTALQNYLGLVWYPGTQELVLAFGTGAIEHVAGYGPRVPGDDYWWRQTATVGFSPAIDNSCLGDNAGYEQLAPARPQNRIEHRYRLSATALAPGTWHLVQVAFTGTRPDHVALMVDGLVGMRVTDGSQVVADGDHYTAPADLRLVTPLAASHLEFATKGAEVYAVDEIELMGPVAQVLPRRGMVRIGNEYISYQQLDGQKLKRCWRARRQDSISGPKPAITEEHAAGALVYPGGYRTTHPSLLTGGNTLAGPLSNGDTRTGMPATPHPYQVWGYIDPLSFGPPPPLATTFVIPQAGALALLLTADPLMNGQLPARGYVLIDNYELVYYTRDLALTPPVLDIAEADRWQSTPTRPSPAPQDRTCQIASPPTVVLVSAELVGPDPTPATRFPPAGLLQLYDANGATATHRAEWVRYDGMVLRGSIGYVLNYNGFNAGQRGQLRTAFGPVDLGDTAFAFPTGTRVLPVQSGNHLVETGDVLTIARQRLSKTAGEQPRQMVVRFAEKDGWGVPVSGSVPTADAFGGYDTSNQHFAFCEALPDHFASQPSHLLCWPCWTSPYDLTTVNDPPNANPAAVLDLLPWGNAWATDVLNGRDPLSGTVTAPSDDRRLHLGADDDRATHNVAGNPTTMAIDALWSGTQHHQGNSTLLVAGIQRGATVIDPLATPATEWITAAETVTTLAAVELAIAGLPGAASDHLLALVGGEVMALRHLRDPVTNGYRSRAAIVGRALLGSAPRAHRGREPVLILPLGPVTPLISTLSATDHDPAPFTALDAPAVMLMEADGTSAATPELLMAPNGWVAPWLRGMYGTNIRSWPVGAGPAPLAVGWWPRYPSALPEVLTSVWPAGAQRTTWNNALLRSRAYAWAGFPLRFRNAGFFASGTNGAPVVTAPDFLGAQVDLIDDADGLYQFEVRALDAGFAWSQAPTVLPGMLGTVDVSDVFASDRFRRAADGAHRLGVSWKRNDPIPVDGAELRVSWSVAPTSTSSMRAALLELARHNRAPMIGTVRLRGHASSQVLSIEAAR